MAHADFLREHTVEAIQTIICINLYLNNMDLESSAKALLGLAIKMAIAMGMSVSRAAGGITWDKDLGREYPMMTLVPIRKISSKER